MSRHMAIPQSFPVIDDDWRWSDWAWRKWAYLEISRLSELKGFLLIGFIMTGISFIFGFRWLFKQPGKWRDSLKMVSLGVIWCILLMIFSIPLFLIGLCGAPLDRSWVGNPAGRKKPSLRVT